MADDNIKKDRSFLKLVHGGKSNTPSAASKTPNLAGVQKPDTAGVANAPTPKFFSQVVCTVPHIGIIAPILDRFRGKTVRITVEEL